MTDPPEDHAARPRTTSSTMMVPQLENAGAEVANITDMDTLATPVNAATVFNADAAVIEDDSATAPAGGDAAASTSVNNIAPTLMSNVETHQCSTATFTGQQSGVVSEEHAADSADSNPSLFAKLAGELQNRIYRAYFEDFPVQKKNNLDIRKTILTYLNVLHTDQMIRAEASSIFFKEYFCCDSFVASMYDLEVTLEFRIKAVCALVAIHNVHLPISVNVQEMISVHEKLVRQLPLTWLDDERRDLVNRLVRFIADGTREVFVCRIGPQEQLEGPEDSPYEHMVYVGRKVHVSPNYRIERVDPDAAVSPEQ